MPKCLKCGAEMPPRATICAVCMTRAPSAGVAAEGGDATGGIIPYKNPPALVAYYLGLFSILPFLGLPLGIASLVLGLKGLKKRRENPAVSGAVHSWIGIGCGGLSILIWGGGLVLFLIASVSGN